MLDFKDFKAPTVEAWRDGSSFLPGAEYILEMVTSLVAEGDSLDQILSRLRKEVDLIRRHENGPCSCLDAAAKVVG
jgi:hypothetical protein